MSKADIKYYVVIAIIIGLIVYVEYTKPKPVDWTVTYENTDTNPYGSYILHETLNDIFFDKKIINNKKTLFQKLDKKKYSDKQNYIFICNEFSPSKIDTKILLELAENGNSIFISASRISSVLADSLGVFFDEGLGLSEEMNLSFTNKNLKPPKEYTYKKAISYNYIYDFNKEKTEVLGKQNGYFNFIKINYGKGNFFINTQPVVFTNYGMLTEKNYEYVYKALSYLPVQNTVWDEYYKPNKKHSDQPLKHILGNQSLRFGYYLGWISMIIFIIFTAKRRQRIIPIFKPYKNISLEFVETIGRLYFHRKNHKDIAMKKYTYFAENLKTKYYITVNLDETIDVKKISEKTNVAESTLQRIFHSAKFIKENTVISQQVLDTLNESIEDFYEKSEIS